MNMLPMFTLANHMESLQMSMLHLNASAKLDMLVMFLLALTITNVLKQMLATSTPHARILVVCTCKTGYSDDGQTCTDNVPIPTITIVMLNSFHVSTLMVHINAHVLKDTK